MPSVHTSPEKFTVHINPSLKWSFSKTFFKLEELENAAFLFSCGQNTVCKRYFSKTMASRYHVISLPEFSSNINPKWLVIAAFQISQA